MLNYGSVLQIFTDSEILKPATSLHDLKISMRDVVWSIPVCCTCPIPIPIPVPVVFEMFYLPNISSNAKLTCYLLYGITLVGSTFQSRHAAEAAFVTGRTWRWI